jgi:hypothetical protein
MSTAGVGAEAILERISEIQRELELLKRDLIRNSVAPRRSGASSLYGAVKGGDITEQMIEEAQHSLFRDLEDL